MGIKPNFTDSELYCIEDAVKDMHKNWLKEYHNPQYESHREISQGMIDVLEKLKRWKKDEMGYFRALDTMIKNPINKAQAATE